MTDQHDARDAFERAYEAHLMPSEADWFRKDSDGDYVHSHTDSAWVGWQLALAATQPAKPEQQAGGVPAGLEAFDQAVADEALMRQALETIENGQQVRNFEGGTKFQPPLENAAITALRKRLESSK